jgi:hypothetical protein
MEFFGIFQGDDIEDHIAEKKPFLGKLPEGSYDYDWNEYMRMLDTHPKEALDKNSKKFRIGLNSFHGRPSAPMFAKMIEAEMQDTFALHGNSITNISFSGFGTNSDSYPWHKDQMDVFLVQVISTVKLRVEGINNNEEFDFKPGDYVWLPRGTHHQVIPQISRVTFSFGVEGDPDPSIYF